MELEDFLPEIITLDRSRTAHAFSKEESLWKIELSRMFKLIRGHVETLASESERARLSRVEDSYRSPTYRHSGEHAYHRQNVLSVAIFGAYGSGKSSLLHTFREEVQSLRRNKNELNVYALPVIEPRRMTGDHFLYDFLATALETDEKERSKEYGETGGYGESDPDRILSPVAQVFQEMSDYLQVVDDPLLSRPQDYDPIGVSLDRLERNTSGLRLREKMETFIDELANSLAGPGGNSVILLPVDDADMSFDILSAVLDTYRHYLMHPRLIPIFTFTGRLAEELLTAHFKRDLMTENATDEHLLEASTQLSVHENLAVQYLAKLFPVRNRIRLGPAPARVQAARFQLSALSGENVQLAGEQKGRSVQALLQIASRLLFGCAEWPEVLSVRPPLRSSTLRRQLQILDALEASKVSQYVTPQDETDNEEGRVRGDDNTAARPRERPPLPTTSWAVVFNRTVWAMLNVHRDTLKELHLNLEDLYSWSQGSLRHVVLEGILSLPLEERRMMIKRWRYKTEDRRSQMLSLLAANAFRPRMEGEEPTGDEPDSIVRDYGSLASTRRKHSFSVRKGFIWFVNLWIGFYLPQILARNRRRDLHQMHHDVGRVRGVGWGLRSGPVHAMREALANEAVFSTGMVLISVRDINSVVEALHKKASKDPELMSRFHKARILGRLWFFLGYERGIRWGAISLWRGLGLAAQLLQDGVRFRAVGHDLPEPYVTSLLKEHIRAASIAGAPSRRTARVHDQTGLKFHPWSGEGSDGKVLPELEELARCVLSWIELFTPEKFQIHPMLTRDREDLKEKCKRSCPGISDEYIDTSPRGLIMWDHCHVRLFHGDSLMGDFWATLQTSMFESSTEKWTALEILQKWMVVLVDYFPSRSYMSLLLMTCPFVRPFFPDAKKEIDEIVEASIADQPSENREEFGLWIKEKIGASNFVRGEDPRQLEMLRFADMGRVSWPESPFYDERSDEPAPEKI